MGTIATQQTAQLVFGCGIRVMGAGIILSLLPIQRQILRSFLVLQDYQVQVKCSLLEETVHLACLCKSWISTVGVGAFHLLVSLLYLYMTLFFTNMEQKQPLHLLQQHSFQ